MITIEIPMVAYWIGMGLLFCNLVLGAIDLWAKHHLRKLERHHRLSNSGGLNDKRN